MAETKCEYEEKEDDETLQVILSSEGYQALCVLASSRHRCVACFARGIIEAALPKMLVAELERLHGEFPQT